MAQIVWDDPKVQWDKPTNKNTPILAPEPPSFGGFMENIPKSAGRLIAGVGSSLLHPIDTAKGLGRIAAGAAEKLVPESLGMRSAEIPYADAVGTMVKERYGGIDPLLKTAYEDPVGMLADVSAVAGAGGGLLSGSSKLGIAGEVAPKLARAGKVLSATAETIDPLRLGVKALRPLIRKGGAAGAEMLGKTTGTGSEAIKTAFSENTPAFRDAMRGNRSEMDVLNDVREALQGAKNQRGAAYQEKLAELSKNTEPLDIAPVRQALEKKLVDFNIKATPPEPSPEQFTKASEYAKASIAWSEKYGDLKPNELDFSRSTITDAADQAKVRATVEDIRSWGKNPEDLTPLGVDTLKRRIADRFSPSSEARALINGVRESVKGELNKVPQYQEMTKGYATASDFIDSIESELSTGNANKGVAIRKLQYALNQNNDYRKFLIESLEQFQQNPNLKQQIAGTTLSRAAPRGIVGAMSASALIGAIMTGSISPHALVALAAHSPRATGELVTALSMMKKLSEKSGNIPGGIYRPLQLPQASGQ